MFSALELEGTEWLTAAPKVQTQADSRISKSRCQSPFFSINGLQTKASSTELLYTIPVYSDPARIHYSVAEELNSAKHNQSSMPTSIETQVSTMKKQISSCSLPRTFQQTSSSCASFQQNGQAPAKCLNITPGMRMFHLTSQISLNLAT